MKSSELDIPVGIHKGLDLIFAMSSGTIALSITFKSSVITTQALCLWLLSMTWILLGASCLLFVLLQFSSGVMEFYVSSVYKRIDEETKKIDKMKSLFRDRMKDIEALNLGSAKDDVIQQIAKRSFAEIDSIKLEHDERHLRAINTASVTSDFSYRGILVTFTLGMICFVLFAVINN